MTADNLHNCQIEESTTAIRDGVKASSISEYYLQCPILEIPSNCDCKNKTRFLKEITITAHAVYHQSPEELVEEIEQRGKKRKVNYSVIESDQLYKEIIY
jgi:hypothetical protein